MGVGGYLSRVRRGDERESCVSSVSFPSCDDGIVARDGLGSQVDGGLWRYKVERVIRRLARILYVPKGRIISTRSGSLASSDR